jgi:hypothetical protein
MAGNKIDPETYTNQTEVLDVKISPPGIYFFMSAVMEKSHMGK